MRIALFGGSGRVGSLVLARALAAGHEVRAFARDNGRLPILKGLTVVEGALDDREAVAETLKGTEVVLCCLAAGNGTLALFDDAAIPLMQKQGPRRIISMVGAAVYMRGDPAASTLHLMTGMMRLVPGGLLADAEAHAADLVESGLDWTLVRSANHSSRPPHGRIIARPGYAMRLGASISRADLAQFMLDIAVDGRFVREAPMVENG